jgi:hypothetical protein
VRTEIISISVFEMYKLSINPFPTDYYCGLSKEGQSQILSFCHMLTGALHQCTFETQNLQEADYRAQNCTALFRK